MILLYLVIGLCYEVYTFYVMPEEELEAIQEKIDGSVLVLFIATVIFSLVWPITMLTRRMK